MVVEVEPIENWIMDVDPVIVIVPSETHKDEDTIEDNAGEDS